jgi:hypothetical protein
MIMTPTSAEGYQHKRYAIRLGLRDIEGPSGACVMRTIESIRRQFRCEPGT